MDECKHIFDLISKNIETKILRYYSKQKYTANIRSKVII